MNSVIKDLPKNGIEGLKENWKADLLSGFLVFLIALPLCLGIASACKFPAISGIMTAIVSGLLVTFFQGSYVTIKGPAAGLIVIIIGCVETLGGGNDRLGYELTLAVIVVAGIIQILFGIFKTGALGDFFPSSAVHGMLAAIGIIIASKQIHKALGVDATGKEPFDLIAEIPHSIIHMNPEVAAIGLVSLLILFTLPMARNKYIKMIPAPMLVILIAIPLGHYFDLEHIHKYLFLNTEYLVGPSYLVSLPANLLDGFVKPDWSKIFTYDSAIFVVMFALVGSLESLLSTKAVDILDPYKRKSNLNKDMLAIGIGNTICGLIGALPMISEIVRSSANINSGAKTKWSNFFHGIFLLLFVALLPGLIHQIPLAALAAMLIFTGYKLASPKVFVETYKVGKEQLMIFITTLIVTLATDLIIGIFSGILVKFILHLYAGAPLKSLFKSNITVSKSEENTYTLKINDAAIFSNYLGFKRHLDKIPAGNKIVLDFNTARLIDHTVMEHLHHYAEDYIRTGGEIAIRGLEKFSPWSTHPLSYRVFNNKQVDEKTPRVKELKAFAKSLHFTFKESNPLVMTNFGKFSSELINIKYEGNVINGTIDGHVYTLSDLSIVGGGNMKAEIYQVTVLSISNLHLGIPIFKLEREAFFDKIMEKAFIDDIDFDEHPDFSKRFKLQGINETAVRKFFTSDIIQYFEKEELYSIESMGAELIIYKPKYFASAEETKSLFKFGKNLIDVISKKTLKEVQL